MRLNSKFEHAFKNLGTLVLFIFIISCTDLDQKCLDELESEVEVFGVCKEYAHLICFDESEDELDYSEVPNHEKNYEQSCDGIDNDCDGQVDENLLNLCGECGPRSEFECDGEDNDCDGEIDEGLTNACGVCETAENADQFIENCDGEDNDCDGQVDEALRNACNSCGTLHEETCNLIDDDCDGRIDEGFRSQLGPNQFLLCEQIQVTPSCGDFCPLLDLIPIWHDVKIGDSRQEDESPVHLVTLESTQNRAAFYMASSEITIGQYRDCVTHGPCTAIENEEMISAFIWPSRYDAHPEYRVTWKQARVYAQWIGGDLPTEREWEAAWINYKLADLEHLSFREQLTPISLSEQVESIWNQVSEDDRLNFLDQLMRYEWLNSHFAQPSPQAEIAGQVLWTRPVPPPKSQSDLFEDVTLHYEPEVHIHDLLGNVWEWTLDEYDATAYSEEATSAQQVHCLASECDDEVAHVARGGGSIDGQSAVRPSNRASNFLIGRTGIRVIFKD